jgi:predicted O-linked N-acetylglucosamine transferase (SPINDLY family)
MNNQINQMMTRAVESFHGGNFDQTELILTKILEIQSKNFDALHIMGVVKGIKNQHRDALELFKKALKIDSRNSFLHFNIAKAFSEIGEAQRAIKYHLNATKLNPNNPEGWLNYGKSLLDLNRPKEALDLFIKAIYLNPQYAEAWTNRGVALQQLMSFEEALLTLDEALKINPRLAEAWSNRGIVLQELKRLDEALTSYDRAIEFKPDNADDYYNRGIVLQELKRLDEALTSYDRAIELKPDYEYLFGTTLHTKMKMCDWQDFDANVKSLLLKISEGKKSSPSFAILALTDSLSVQRKASETWIKDKHPFNPSLGLIPKYEHKNKIRIGYYSADFRDHPVSILMAELFELHDRSKFEVIAFYSGPSDSSEMHKRVACAFDKFIDIRLTSDRDVAQISRDMHIDIAIDLTGLTQHARTGVFSFRAAPIQINYLGYSATMGVEYYHYIIADKVVIPKDKQKNYVEKIIYLPNCYLPHDSEQKISSQIFSKQECGLPLDGFVFCCFNAAYKLNPTIFDSWMRILKATGSSVLWLSSNNNSAMANLRMEAEKRGINSSRLIFAQRTKLIEEHLARHSLADLFLDTLPYNAHTTTLDALWAGLPVLTCMGESFASRAAASALNAIELPELITTSQEKYEASAIELATSPAKLKAIKDKLERNRMTTALFDTPRFTKHIEDAYTQMYERYQADLPLDHIYIED